MHPIPVPEKSKKTSHDLIEPFLDSFEGTDKRRDVALFRSGFR